MQVIAAAAGARVVPSGLPMHGKTATVEHDGVGLFAGLPNPINVGLYHSLIVEAASLGPPLQVSARSVEGVVMGVRWDGLPIDGLLFHPESFLTEAGDALLANFLG